jgi:16S rRNA (guanine527-N7)-methyltransferase
VTSREFQDKLRRRARKAGVRLAPDVAAGLETYYRLLSVWNEKINLTGFSPAEVSPEAIDRLLIEPLVAAGHVPQTAQKVLDVGSGGGSPAIPMALALPRIQLLMVESKTRKSVFLREALRALALARAAVATARLEELLSRPDLHEAHDLVTVRAVRLEMRNLVALQAFVRPGGLIFLFRTSGMTDPAEVVPPPLTWRATFPLLENLRSRLVVLEKLPARGGVPRGTL